MGSERCDDIDECAQGACGSETCYNMQGDYKWGLLARRNFEHFRCICAFDQIFDEEKKECVDGQSVSFSSSDYDWYVPSERGECYTDFCGGYSIGMDTGYTDCCCGSGNLWLLSGEDQCSPCPKEFTSEWDQLCSTYDSSAYKVVFSEFCRKSNQFSNKQQKFEMSHVTYATVKNSTPTDLLLKSAAAVQA